MDKKEIVNNEKQISKNEFMNYLKSSTWISGSMSYNKDNDNKSFNVILGEKMPRTDNISLILKELKTINTRLDGIDTRLDGIDTRLDNLEKDVSSLKTDVSSLKTEAKKHGWDIK